MSPGSGEGTGKERGRSVVEVDGSPPLTVDLDTEDVWTAVMAGGVESLAFARDHRKVHVGDDQPFLVKHWLHEPRTVGCRHTGSAAAVVGDPRRLEVVAHREVNRYVVEGEQPIGRE